MLRTKFIKLFIFIIITILITSGCDKNSSSEDIIKIVPDDHALIKEYTEFKSDNALNEGKINLHAGNIQQAIEILEKFITYHPTNSMGHFYLSKACYENNELDKSLQHLKRAILLDHDLEKELAGPVIGKDIIGRVFVTNKIDEEKNLAYNPKLCFDINTNIIYASLEIINAPPDSEIEVEWIYELSKNEEVDVNSVLINAKGSENALISIKKPSSGWPAGKYRLNVFVNGKKNTNLNFYIF